MMLHYKNYSLLCALSIFKMQIPEFLTTLGYGSKRGRGVLRRFMISYFSLYPMKIIHTMDPKFIFIVYPKSKRSFFKQWRILHHCRWRGKTFLGLCSTLMALRREFYRATHGMRRKFLLIGADPGLRDCKGVIPWRNSGVLVSMSYSKFWIYWVGVNTKLLFQSDKSWY